MNDFYAILGIHTQATNQQILAAFKEKAKEYHPDKNGGSKVSEEMFKMIQLSKETLLDPSKRLEHDYACGIKPRPIAPQSQASFNAGKVFGGA